MTTSFTKDRLPMVNPYELEIAQKALLAEKIILFPTDTVWSLGVLPTSPELAQKVLHLKGSQKREHFELLFESIGQVKEYIPFIHPRLETLLAFHQRPLTFVVNAGNSFPEEIRSPEGGIAVRIVRDSFSRKLIQSVNSPILTAPANAEEDAYPSHFGAIRSDLLQGVDYVVKFRQKENTPNQISVKVLLNENEELIFIRE